MEDDQWNWNDAKNMSIVDPSLNQYELDDDTPVRHTRFLLNI